MIKDAGRQIDVIVEARMTSSRLPGKVLMPAVGKPMLELMVERLRLIPEITKIIIATTENCADEPIVALAEMLGVDCFRGDEEDVLGRVVKAAQRFKTDIIVEITGDDPLLDPELSSAVIKTFLMNESKIDYAANDIDWTFPIGLNTRAFSRGLLEKVERLTFHPVDREHVVNYIVKHPDQFRLHNIPAAGIYRRKDIRLTLDTAADYQVIKTVFETLYPMNPAFTAKEVIRFLNAHPEVLKLNQYIVQRTYSYE